VTPAPPTRYLHGDTLRKNPRVAAPLLSHPASAAGVSISSIIITTHLHLHYHHHLHHASSSPSPPPPPSVPPRGEVLAVDHSLEGLVIITHHHHNDRHHQNRRSPWVQVGGGVLGVEKFTHLRALWISSSASRSRYMVWRARAPYPAACRVPRAAISQRVEGGWTTRMVRMLLVVMVTTTTNDDSSGDDDDDADDRVTHIKELVAAGAGHGLLRHLVSPTSRVGLQVHQQLQHTVDLRGCIVGEGRVQREG
jgi:hypothetical protein